MVNVVRLLLEKQKIWKVIYFQNAYVEIWSNMISNSNSNHWFKK